MSLALAKLSAALRAFAFSFPGAYEEHPWGESVAKVTGKVFVFLGQSARLRDEVGFSVKLPRSGIHVLDLSCAEPTGYGLGKSGWVTIRLGERDDLDLDLLKGWIEESYRAVAPKRLVAELGPLEGFAREPAAKPARVRPAAAKRKAPRKTTSVSRRPVVRKRPSASRATQHT